MKPPSWQRLATALYREYNNTDPQSIGINRLLSIYISKYVMDAAAT